MDMHALDLAGINGVSQVLVVHTHQQGVHSCGPLVPALTRSLGRPKNRWEDDVKSDITRMKITNWKDCIRNRTKWKKLVEKAKTSLKL